MSFSTFTTLGDVARAYQIKLDVHDFVEPRPFTISKRFRRDLDFVLTKVAYRASEFAICENLVYPILKEVWMPYAEEMQLWCHTPLSFDKDLTGTPDYFLARRSLLGTEVMEKPLLMVMEAKKDDFDWGWAQCLAAMIAAQKLNNSQTMVIHGITTTGRFLGVWQIARERIHLRARIGWLDESATSFRVHCFYF